MNDLLETSPAPAPDSNGRELRELQLGFAGLKKIITLALLLLLILAGIYNLLTIRLMISVRKDLSTMRPQVNAMVQQYEKNEGPAIKAFYESLFAYAKTHPQFIPILVKHGLIANPGQ